MKSPTGKDQARPAPTGPLGGRPRYEGLIELIIALVVLGFGVVVFLDHPAGADWSPFRVVVIAVAAFFGLGFVARAVRAFVQRRRFARIADAPPDPPDRA